MYSVAAIAWDANASNARPPSALLIDVSLDGLPPIVQNLDEGSAAQFLQRQPSGTGLFFGKRAAVDSAQEEVKQSLPCRGVVKNVAHERSLRRFRDEVPQTLRRRLETLEKKRVHRCKSRGKLARMQIPALIVTVLQGPLDVLEMQPHGAPHNFSVIAHRHYIGGAVR